MHRYTQDYRKRRAEWLLNHDKALILMNYIPQNLCQIKELSQNEHGVLTSGSQSGDNSFIQSLRQALSLPVVRWSHFIFPFGLQLFKEGKTLLKSVGFSGIWYIWEVENTGESNHLEVQRTLQMPFLHPESWGSQQL